jgi:hypothetical protein
MADKNDNLQIFTDPHGRIITDDEDLNRIIREVEDEEGMDLGMVIPAITFENNQNPDEKVYLVLLTIYDTESNTGDVLRQWEIKVGRQATYDYLKELVKYESIDPNTSFIIGGDMITNQTITDKGQEEKTNVSFHEVSPITVFRFLKAMRDSKKILDGDEMFDINDFDIHGASGDSTIFVV